MLQNRVQLFCFLRIIPACRPTYQSLSHRFKHSCAGFFSRGYHVQTGFSHLFVYTQLATLSLYTLLRLLFGFLPGKNCNSLPHLFYVVYYLSGPNKKLHLPLPDSTQMVYCFFFMYNKPDRLFLAMFFLQPFAPGSYVTDRTGFISSYTPIKANLSNRITVGV